MANRIMTSMEVAEDMLNIARVQVSTLPEEEVRALAKLRQFPIGIGGAILAALAVAAKERLASVQEEAEGDEERYPARPRGGRRPAFR